MLEKMKALEISDVLFNILGIKPTKITMFSLIRTVIGTTILITYVLSSVFDMVWNWVDITGIVKLEVVPPAMKALTTIWIYLINYKRIPQIREYTKVLRSYSGENEEYDKIRTKYDDLTNLLSRNYVRMILITTCGYFGRAIYQGVFAFSAYPFCNFENSFCYGSVTIYQISINQVICWALMAADITFLYLIMNVYAECEVIKSGLQSMNTVKYNYELNSLAIHHVEVLVLLDDVCVMHADMLLLQYWSSMCSICICLLFISVDGYPPKLDVMIEKGSFLFASLCQLCIYCFAGTIISEQTVSIAESAYDVKWYARTNPMLRKSLALVIQRSQKPGILTIGGLAVCDLEKLPLVLKLSVSFMTMISELSGGEL